MMTSRHHCKLLNTDLVDGVGPVDFLPQGVCRDGLDALSPDARHEPGVQAGDYGNAVYGERGRINEEQVGQVAVGVVVQQFQFVRTGAHAVLSSHEAEVAASAVVPVALVFLWKVRKRVVLIYVLIDDFYDAV